MKHGAVVDQDSTQLDPAHGDPEQTDISSREENTDVPEYTSYISRKYRLS